MRLRLLVAAVAAGNLLAMAPVMSEPITITARPAVLDFAVPERTRVGHLEFCGGLLLTSADRRFGGLSGLLVAADGTHFRAISDEGWLLTGRLLFDAEGRPRGIGDAEILPLPLSQAKSRGAPSKQQADAESLAEDGRGGFLVGFERNHRILQYPKDGAPPARLAPPADLKLAPANAGLEALARFPDGRLLALTEGFYVRNSVRGWIGGPRKWQPLTWRTSEAFQPTDAAVLPDGDLLVLERRFPPVGIRLRRVSSAAVRPGALLDGVEIARFEGSLNTDNMEGLSVRRDAHGSTLVYLLSDDNYNPLQRTLLMMFRLID